MGSHYGALLVKDALPNRVEDILRLVAGGKRQDGPAVAEEVTGFQPLDRTQLAIAVHPAWTLAYGRPLLPDDEAFFQTLAAWSHGTKVLYWAVEDTSGFLGFACFVEGETVRRWFELEGEIFEHEGEPLPGEPPGMFTDEPGEEADEWTVIDVMASESLSWEAVNALRFSVYRIPA